MLEHTRLCSNNSFTGLLPYGFRVSHVALASPIIVAMRNGNDYANENVMDGYGLRSLEVVVCGRLRCIVVLFSSSMKFYFMSIKAQP